jgi:hypothetical protein
MKLLHKLGCCLLLLPMVTPCIRAQGPYPPSAAAATRGALPQDDPFSPFGGRLLPDPFAVEFSQLPKPPDGSTALSDQQSKQAQAARERTRIESCKDFVQSAMGADRQRVSVTLQDHKRLVGFIIAATPEQFVMRNLATQQEHAIRYEDVARWRVIRSPGERARNVGQTICLVLLSIPLLPLMLLAGLAGWDGC